MADKVERAVARIDEQAAQEAEEIVTERPPERMSREAVEAELAEHQAYLRATDTERRAREIRMAELGAEPMERTDISTMPRPMREDLMKHECRLCGALFEADSGLEVHLENFHPGMKNERPKE